MCGNTAVALYVLAGYWVWHGQCR